MVVAIRLARYALSRNNPAYNIVAINSTLRIRARPIEILGSYLPLPTLTPPVSTSPNGSIRGLEWGSRQAESVKGKMQKVGEKSVNWNEQRLRYWLQQGAVPSKRVEKLLISAGVLDTNPLPAPVPLTSNLPSALPSTRRVISRTRRLREAIRKMEPALLVDFSRRLDPLTKIPSRRGGSPSSQRDERPRKS